MTRQTAVSVDNNFSGGLITEATALSFPPNACKEIYDCDILEDASITRRLGFDHEDNYSNKVIDRNGRCISQYVWKNVSGNGNITLHVLQTGNLLTFYKVETASISPGLLASSVTLEGISGAPTIQDVEAQFTSGNGSLIVTHPYCNPIRISFDEDTDTVTAVAVDLKVRDFEGAEDDPYLIDQRPAVTYATMDADHRYNLLNQGWLPEHILNWEHFNGSVPSNCDINWLFRDANDVLTFTSQQIAKVVQGNSPAPKGHYIFSAVNISRSSTMPGVENTTSSYFRPSTCAFFAGRAFYSGINYPKYTSNIYFSQVIERDSQFEACYQVNDPTSENNFELLPTDGGVISIQEAGTIIKLAPVTGGLAVIASNGTWLITGSQGLGFTANDYSVQKISSIGALSASSFIDIEGSPCWWNAEGIWVISSEGGSIPVVRSITNQKIDSFFSEIPLESKRYAKGCYNSLDAVARWTYKNEESVSVVNRYEFDRVLNFKVKQGAFHVWRISNSTVKVHGVSAPDVFSTTAGLVDKYLISSVSGGLHNFTFAEIKNTSYLDWETYDSTGVSYSSSFTTGYKLGGSGNTKWQPTWTTVYSKTETPVVYYFQGIWDFANTASGTGRWSVKQYVSHEDMSYDYAKRRLKVRGHGVALQFKVQSVGQNAFHIIGWSALNTANQLP